MPLALNPLRLIHSGLYWPADGFGALPLSGCGCEPLVRFAERAFQLRRDPAAIADHTKPRVVHATQASPSASKLDGGSAGSLATSARAASRARSLLAPRT